MGDVFEGAGFGDAGFEGRGFEGCGDDGPEMGGANPAPAGTRSAVRLSEILPAARFIACRDVLGRGVSDQAEACGVGDIFVARERADRDGHDDVADAIARGVAGVVAERIVPTFGIPLCLV